MSSKLSEFIILCTRGKGRGRAGTIREMTSCTLHLEYKVYTAYKSAERIIQCKPIAVLEFACFLIFALGLQHESVRKRFTFILQTSSASALAFGIARCLVPVPYIFRSTSLPIDVE